MSAAPYHRILELSVEGGFLRGVNLEFREHLNCLIGARGTGKSTVLEILRWALNRMPHPRREKARHDRIQGLLEANLEGATVTVRIETSKGTRYRVERAWKDKAPRVYDESGEPASFSLGKGHVFDADVLSHNEIEEIASDAAAQLALLDRFTGGAVERLTKEVTLIEQELRQVLSRIRERVERVSFLEDVTGELPELRERLKAMEVTGSDERSRALRQANSLKALRGQEEAFLARLGELHGEGAARLEEALGALGREYESALSVELSGSPNAELIGEARADAEAALQAVRAAIARAADALRAAGTRLEPRREALARGHATQEKEYQALQSAYQEDRAAAQERVDLEQQVLDLEEKARELERVRDGLGALKADQERARQRLSELREERFGHRQRAAAELTKALGPQIKADVLPNADRGALAALLSEAMKGSGLRYQSIVKRVIGKKVPPAELVSILQGEDRERLERQLGLSTEQATKMLYHLKDSRHLAALEVVELHDEPVIQLLDGDYKPSKSLSQGQKCTTILPILLLESERPLLIDQPEDNVDNAYVNDTICRSIRAAQGRRQLIVVTHSANVPVLGDAGRVFLMQSSGDRASVGRQGSVDELKDEIVEIMEGGREAFQTRRDLYGA